MLGFSSGTQLQFEHCSHKMLDEFTNLVLRLPAFLLRFHGRNKPLAISFSKMLLLSPWQLQRKVRRRFLQISRRRSDMVSCLSANAKHLSFFWNDKRIAVKLQLSLGYSLWNKVDALCSEKIKQQITSICGDAEITSAIFYSTLLHSEYSCWTGMMQDISKVIRTVDFKPLLLRSSRNGSRFQRVWTSFQMKSNFD